MAPERFGGGAYDFASDVWSIGIMTVEALTGKHPYSTQNFISISMSVTNKPSPAPPEGTPEEICEFVRVCLLKEPRQRAGARMLCNTASGCARRGAR